MNLELHVRGNDRRKLVLRHIHLHPLFQGMAARQGIDLAPSPLLVLMCQNLIPRPRG